MRVSSLWRERKAVWKNHKIPTCTLKNIETHFAESTATPIRLAYVVPTIADTHNPTRVQQFTRIIAGVNLVSNEAEKGKHYLFEISSFVDSSANAKVDFNTDVFVFPSSVVKNGEKRCKQQE